ncbi:hypothetical protein LJB90_03260, partial [Eubacteriales bacterium OttesenSCG-928-G02]|nr:hypothetical protein [Eubacteriales bacterium OttesenSCG-928-G02]
SIKDYPTEYITNPLKLNLLQKGHCYYIDLPNDGYEGKVLAVCNGSSGDKIGSYLDLLWKLSEKYRDTNNNGVIDIFENSYWTVILDKQGNPIRP